MMKEVRTSSDDLAGLLLRIRLRATADGLDDLISRAIKQKWSHRQLLEEMARQEVSARAARNLERRLQAARIGRFKTMADFDWNWPKKIDREVIERWLRLEPIAECRNLILLGSNGVGKTTIAKNAGYQAVMAGRSVLFRTASDLMSDLSCDSTQLRKRKLRLYGRVDLLCVDEVGYLAYDSHAADLLYEVVSRRYESGAIVMTTNRSFKDWNEVFPNATSIGTMCDRLLHHADVVVIEGSSYRRRESEAEKAARRNTP